MQSRAIFFFAAVLVSLPLFSQSNEYLDSFLESDSVSIADSAYLIFISKDPEFETKTTQDAKQILSDRYGISGEEITTAKDLAKICMEEYGLPKGLFYMLSKSPRYAYRDMQFAGFLQGISDPGQILSPEDVLRVITVCHETWSGTL